MAPLLRHERNRRGATNSAKRQASSRSLRYRAAVFGKFTLGRSEHGYCFSMRQGISVPDREIGHHFEIAFPRGTRLGGTLNTITRRISKNGISIGPGTSSAKHK